MTRTAARCRGRLAADVVAVVRLAVLVDIVAIAAGIAVILFAVDRRPSTPPRTAPAIAPVPVLTPGMTAPATAPATAADDRALDGVPGLRILGHSRYCSHCCNSHCCIRSPVAPNRTDQSRSPSPRRWRPAPLQLPISSCPVPSKHAPCAGYYCLSGRFVPASILPFAARGAPSIGLWPFRAGAIERVRETRIRFHA